MQFTIEVRQSTPQTARAAVPSRLWSLDLTASDDGQFAMSGARPYSFLSECECPDDCLRDHENE